MKVKCVFNKASDVLSHLNSVGYTSSTPFGVEVGREYIVYSMCLNQGDILCLIDEGYGRIYWCPLVLFEVIDSKIPNCWYFSQTGVNDRYCVSAIWGYYEMVYMPEHFDALVDLDHNAMLIFAKRRKEIEDEEPMN